MAENSKIEWTQDTWNPWKGCIKISHGCKFCYMYRDQTKYGNDPKSISRSKTTFRDPLKWKEPRLIFTCSWSDFFIEEADQWREEAWEIIRQTPHHTYQILTKRPERIMDCLPDDWGDGYENVWLGISVENQDVYLYRVQSLIDVPAKVRFLSMEPLLESVDLYLNFYASMFDFSKFIYEKIDWVIVGGESGNENGKFKYRSCEIAWIKSIIQQCNSFGIPVFVKQLGTHLSNTMQLTRHGKIMEEWPKELQVRDMPKSLSI